MSYYINKKVPYHTGYSHGRDSKQWWYKGTRKSAAQLPHRWAVVRSGVAIHWYLLISQGQYFVAADFSSTAFPQDSTTGSQWRKLSYWSPCLPFWPSVHGVYQPSPRTGKFCWLCSALKAGDLHTDSIAKISALFSQRC